MTPAPRKPIPVTICAAIRPGSTLVVPTEVPATKLDRTMKTERHLLLPTKGVFQRLDQTVPVTISNPDCFELQVEIYQIGMPL